ncbi:hypothetical protein N0V88_000569 [Collariella sp. IMI 366227]|nr:hypothetical protein N0V88_000569 [Collariella sp. IMI 366227]
MITGTLTSGEDIFRNRQAASWTRLADLYQHLGLEYFLVPADVKFRPILPSLTLSGWTQWLTLSMRAYPNEESHRLAKVVAAMPINADSLLDGKPERLPKQISRRLLPTKPNRDARIVLDDALQTHLSSLRPPSPTTTTAKPPLSPTSTATLTTPGPATALQAPGHPLPTSLRRQPP